jgi:hypothetical protein
MGVSHASDTRRLAATRGITGGDGGRMAAVSDGFGGMQAVGRICGHSGPCQEQAASIFVRVEGGPVDISSALSLT